MMCAPYFTEKDGLCGELPDSERVAILEHVVIRLG